MTRRSLIQVTLFLLAGCTASVDDHGNSESSGTMATAEAAVPACPADAPQSGSACQVPNLRCFYKNECGGSLDATCQDGSWSIVTTGCSSYGASSSGPARSRLYCIAGEICTEVEGTSCLSCQPCGYGYTCSLQDGTPTCVPGAINSSNSYGNPSDSFGNKGMFNKCR